MDLIIKINSTLDEDDKKGLRLFSHFVEKDIINVIKIIEYMKDFLGIIKRENVPHTLIYFKQTRIWLCYNLLRVLNLKLIDPKISNDLYDNIYSYSYVLDIFKYLDDCLLDCINNPSEGPKPLGWLLRQFFTIDIELKNKSNSQCDAINYILNTYQESQINQLDFDINLILLI